MTHRSSRALVLALAVLCGAASVSADEYGSGRSLAADALAVLSDVALNELRPPTARLWERFSNYTGIGDCGAYEFTPGGERENAKWVGPSFTLTQTSGSCVALKEFAGDAEAPFKWTRLQGVLACLTPSLQYDFTPLTYSGVTKTQTELSGPSCKQEVKFGVESTIEFTPDKSKRELRFPSQDAFYAAVAQRKVFEHGDLRGLVLKAIDEMRKPGGPDSRYRRPFSRKDEPAYAGISKALRAGQSVAKVLGGRGLFSFKE